MVGLVFWFTSGDGVSWSAWIPVGTPESLGIRMAFWIPGIVGGVILLLLIRAFHNTPEDVGLRQLGADADTPARRPPATGAIAKARTSTFLRQVRRTPAFWNLIGIHYWGCAGHSVVIVFLPAMIISTLEPAGGYGGAGDAALLSATAIAVGAAATMSLVSTITRFGVPIAADMLGSKWVMAVCFFLQVAPVALLFFAILFYPAIWMFYLFAILFGIGFGGEMSAFPIINRQYYGNAPIGTTYGFQMMGAGAGMASGALLGSPAPRFDRWLRGNRCAIFRDEPRRCDYHCVPAQHPPAPVARMGAGPARRDARRYGAGPAPTTIPAQAPAGSGDGN